MTEPGYRFRTREQCPICNGNSEVQYSRSYGEQPVSGFIQWRYRKSTEPIRDACYTIAECSRCALLYQVEVGGADFLNDLYVNWIDDPTGPESYPSYQRDCEHPLESRDAHEIITASRFLAVPLPEMRTLDFGMGWALWARIAHQLDCDSHGTDLAETRMGYARERGVKTVEFGEIPHSSFHFINTEQVMEHLVDPLFQARRLADALLPGGILKVSVPSAEHVRTKSIDDMLWQNDYQGLMPVHPLEHVNGFRKSTLSVLAERLGLQIVKPPLLHRLAFLAKSGTTSLRRPKQTAKELIRPFVQWHMPWNLYCWMRKPLT